MFDLTLTDEQNALVQTARDFARDEDRARRRAPRRGGQVPRRAHERGLRARPHELRDPRGVRRPRAVVPDALAHHGGDRLGVRRREHDAGGEHAGGDAAAHRRHRRAEAEVPRAADGGRGRQARSSAATPAASPTPAATWPACARASRRRATSTSSTARSAGSPTAASPASARPSPRSTPSCATRASPLRRRHEHAGREDRQEGEQDGSARVADQRRHLRGRARAEGEPRSAKRAAASRWR